MITFGQWLMVSYGPLGAPGNFTVAHSLGRAPHGIEILRTSSAKIGLQATGADSSNVYLIASDAGATGQIRLW